MTPSPAGVRVGVDIGGTFTDIVVTRPDGTLLVNKTSSTPDDPARAAAAGLAALLRGAGIARREHGVVIDPASLAVNEAETRALRAGPPAAPGHRRP